MYFVYILKCSDDTFYTGITTNVERRVKEHNTSNKGAKYTLHRRPVKLHYIENCETRSQALTRENQIKKLSHTQKLALGNKSNK